MSAAPLYFAIFNSRGPGPSGSLCAIPKWQSMHVNPWDFICLCRSRAVSLCLSGSIEASLWQLRHSSESVVFMRVQTRVASSYRCFSNFSRVSMTPVSFPQISNVAATLRLSIGIGSRGTWQSEQAARTPERFLSWIVSLNSVATLSRISWHMPPQNASELVQASPAAPPASSTPPTTIVPREMTHHFLPVMVRSRGEAERQAGRADQPPCPTQMAVSCVSPLRPTPCCSCQGCAVVPEVHTHCASFLD